jgi:hypothetical protein
MSRVWIKQLDDGRTEYVAHQSWIGDTDICLERARLGLIGELDDHPSDATSLGTAMHHAIETQLYALRDDGEYIDLERLEDIAQEKFTQEIAQANFQWKKRQERGARNYLDMAVGNWYEHILPKLDPWHIELYFGPYVLFEDDQRVVKLAGTIDYVDRKHGLMDWKSGSAHSWQNKDWEKERFALQPTVYTWAFNQWLIENTGEPAETPMSFRFVAMLDNGAIQKIQVHRRPEDWAWLERKVRGVIAQIERGTDTPWPMNDQHALCSPKYCPAWSACKGAESHALWPK